MESRLSADGTGRNLSVVSIVSIRCCIDRFIMLIDLISSVRSVSDGGRGGNATAVRSHAIDYKTIDEPESTRT